MISSPHVPSGNGVAGCAQWMEWPLGQVALLAHRPFPRTIFEQHI